MLLRDRTKKRLRWFAATIVVIGCLGVVGYFVRDRHLENKARASSCRATCSTSTAGTASP